jgi:hypothetical protein
MNGYKSIIRVLSLASIAVQWKAKAYSSVAFSLEETCHIPLVQEAKGVEHDRDLSFNEFLGFLRRYHANEFSTEWNDDIVRSFMRPTFSRLSTTYCANLLNSPEQCNGSKVVIPKSLHDRGMNSTSIMTREEHLYIFSVCEEGFRSLDMMQSPSFKGIVTQTIYTPKAFDEWFTTLSESWRQLCFNIANDLSSDGNVYNLHETSVENYEKDAITCDAVYSSQLENGLLISDNGINCYRVTLYAHIILNKSLNPNDSSRIFFDTIEDEMRMIDVLDECKSTEDCIFKRFHDYRNVRIGLEKDIIVSICFALTLGLVIAKYLYHKRGKQPSGVKLNSFPLVIPRFEIEDEHILKEGGHLSAYNGPLNNCNNCITNPDTSGRADDKIECDRMARDFENDDREEQPSGTKLESFSLVLPRLMVENELILKEGGNHSVYDCGPVDDVDKSIQNNETQTANGNAKEHCRSISLMSGGF